MYPMHVQINNLTNLHRLNLTNFIQIHKTLSFGKTGTIKHEIWHHRNLKKLKQLRTFSHKCLSTCLLYVGTIRKNILEIDRN